jgi:hypothetical protein
MDDVNKPFVPENFYAVIALNLKDTNTAKSTL